jgi:arylsulfatase A
MIGARRGIALVRLCVSVTLACWVPANAHAERPPNIVFVLADDLGWAELGCYGNGFNETPHLDRLARGGMRFTDAYAAAPVCSPYRAALLTGQHPARIGILDYLRPNSANALSTSHVTLPEMLSRHGYATGKIGKWHLSGYAHHGAEHEIKPADHGFAWDFGGEVKGVGNGANFWPYVFRDQPIRWIDIPMQRLGEDEYLTDRLNREAVDFIERHRDEPFFLYLSHYAPHTILNGRPDLVQKYVRKHATGKSGRDRCYLCEDAGLGKGDPGHHWAIDHNPHLAAMLESIDEGIGQIVAKLDELGLAENTIVIFTSDNGGESNVTSNAPLRGGKSELYEGGIRVPLIVRWPKAIPAGTVCGQPTQNVDFYPTLLAAADIAPDPAQKLDGVSTLETWKTPSTEIARDFLAWHYPLDQPHFLGGVSGGAIRAGDWKLIEHFDSGEVELFSLKDDPSETSNLASDKPKEVASLRGQLAKWRDEIGARIPSPPLLTEPRQLYFAEHFNPNHLSERLWYNADWKADNGVLKRIESGSRDTRIFLRDAEYRDTVIRFDFCLGDAQDVRLMTGSGGHYNTVLHLRPDHFFLQTAKDESMPCFSYRHGECAYDFDPDRWYTMTVEFLGDEAIAHLDHQHLVRAKHPIIDRTREYFALQVDQHAVEFDNVQILTAVARKTGDGREEVESAADRFPVEKPLQEQFEIQKTNAHEWYYQRDEAYRKLVKRVGELDEEKKRRFPDAFRSHKDVRNAIQAERKRLLESNPVYKETLFATYRANREIDEWLVAKQPELDELPDNRRKAAINQLRSRFAEDTELLALAEKAKTAQKKLEADYPQLFITDDEITARKKAAYDDLRDNAVFQRLTRERAETYYAQQDYLLTTDRELKRLNGLLKEGQ